MSTLKQIDNNAQLVQYARESGYIYTAVIVRAIWFARLCGSESAFIAAWHTLN